MPCLSCGEPSLNSRCPDCATERDTRADSHRRSARQRGYDTRWDALSRRARQLQPFCTDCGAADAAQLTLDHLPAAWTRRAEGKAVRLRDVEVVCMGCNAARGSSRPGSHRAGVDPTGDGASARAEGPRGKPQDQLHTSSSQGDTA